MKHPIRRVGQFTIAGAIAAATVGVLTTFAPTVGAATNGPTTYEADCTTSLAAGEVAPFITGLNASASPDPSAPTGAAFGASGSASVTIIGPVIAGVEQQLSSPTIGAAVNETLGSTDGTATGTYAYSHTFTPVSGAGRQITATSWTSGVATITAAAATFTSADVGASVAGPSAGGLAQTTTITAVSGDGSSATLSVAPTASETSATIGIGHNTTFTDSALSTGNVFTTSGTAGGKADIGVVSVTGVTLNTLISIPFGGSTGVGTANCLLTGYDASSVAGPVQTGATTPQLPAGTTTALVAASGGSVTQPGTTTAITPPAAAYVGLTNPVSPLAITTTSLSGGTVGSAYSATLAATGGTTPYTWSISTGTLPAGLTLDPATGAITGTPSASGTTDFTVTATDSSSPAMTANQALSIDVAPATVSPLAITTTSLSGGTVGSAYSATPAATGGTTPYTWSISTGTLPAGLTLDPATGAITGTPSASGTTDFTVTATDSSSPAMTANQALSIVVSSSSCQHSKWFDGCKGKHHHHHGHHHGFPWGFGWGNGWGHFSGGNNK